jgi:hypothetical protein
MKRKILLCVLVVSVLSSTFGAEPTPESKSQYTLFNPTPSESMRAWRTDRAGVSPYTIDAGHFEVDLTVLGYGYDEHEILMVNSTFTTFDRLQIRSEAWRYGAIAAKVGLANWLDAEVAFVPYQTITSEPDHVFRDEVTGRAVIHRTTRSGFSDIVSRLKLNIWGNDGGTTALSVSGNVKFPTASDDLGNGQFEGGPSVEFAAQIPWGFELRINGAANFYEDDRDNGRAAVGSLLSLSHQIVGNLQGYALFDATAFTSGDDWIGSVRAGLNYRIAKDIELYIGNSFGVTEDAFDYEPFIGVAARF